MILATTYRGVLAGVNLLLSISKRLSEVDVVLTAWSLRQVLRHACTVLSECFCTHKITDILSSQECILNDLAGNVANELTVRLQAITDLSFDARIEVGELLFGAFGLRGQLQQKQSSL